MKTKLIEITPEQALKILKENDMEPVDGFVFWDDEEPKYESKLSSVVFRKHVNVRPYGMIEGTYCRHSALIAEQARASLIIALSKHGTMTPAERLEDAVAHALSVRTQGECGRFDLVPRHALERVVAALRDYRALQPARSIDKIERGNWQQPKRGKLRAIMGKLRRWRARRRVAAETRPLDRRKTLPTWIYRR